MRISALMQRARHCYTTSKQAKEQRLKTVRLEREENRADQNAPALFPFLSFLFFRLSLYLALEAYREMSCRVVLIATKWAVSGGSLWAPTVSVFLTGRVGGWWGPLGLKVTFTRQTSRSCSTCLVLLHLEYPYFCSYFHFNVSLVFKFFFTGPCLSSFNVRVVLASNRTIKSLNLVKHHLTLVLGRKKAGVGAVRWG